MAEMQPPRRRKGTLGFRQRGTLKILTTSIEPLETARFRVYRALLLNSGFYGVLSDQGSLVLRVFFSSFRAFRVLAGCLNTLQEHAPQPQTLLNALCNVVVRLSFQALGPAHPDSGSYFSLAKSAFATLCLGIFGEA